MKKINLFLFFIILIAVQTATAGDYKLIEGMGIDVCEDYKKNIESFDNGGEPMACDRKINSEFKDFERPEHTELNVKENIDLLKKIEKYLHRRGWKYDIDKDFINWKKMVINHSKRGKLRMQLSYVDIDNDGSLDYVLYYLTGVCRTTKYYGIPIIVLNNDLTDINKRKTLFIMQNPTDIYNSDHGGWQGAMYSIFKYKGETYFDRWADGWDQEGLLRVFKFKNKQDAEICTYKYNNRK